MVTLTGNGKVSAGGRLKEGGGSIINDIDHGINHQKSFGFI